MASASSLIPELDDIIKHGSARRRADAIARISELFLEGAAQFETRHVALFDDILTGLVPRTEIETRMELAERLSRLDNAPPTLVKQLAHEDEIKIAGPILSRSPLIDEPTLVDIARAKGQDHLAAISERPTLSAPVTDVIVRRGDRDVVRSVAANAGAQFSEHGYSGLVSRATEDGTLALTVGQREDIPAASLKQLLAKSVEAVRRRLFEAAKPQQKAALDKAMKEISSTSCCASSTGSCTSPTRRHRARWSTGWRCWSTSRSSCCRRSGSGHQSGWIPSLRGALAPRQSSSCSPRAWTGLLRFARNDEENPAQRRTSRVLLRVRPATA
jgi:uncharacterized protein (DUF2336 family)